MAPEVGAWVRKGTLEDIKKHLKKQAIEMARTSLKLNMGIPVL